MIKILLRSCLKWGMMTAASVIILFAVLISGVRMTVPLLNHQRDFFEHWASHALHQPVHIGQIATSWYGFNPALTFQKVIVTDPTQHKSLLRVSQLSISVNLFQSLIHWRLFPGHVWLSGASFNVFEGKDGKLNVEGMIAQKKQVFTDLGEMKKVFLGLLNQSNITLKNIDIYYHTAEGQLIPLTHLRLKVTNGLLHQQIAGVGSLSQTVPTRFRFLLQGSSKNAELYLDIKNLVFSQWESSYFLQKYFKRVSLTDGRGNVQLWAKFKNDELESVQSVVKSDQIRLSVAKSHSPLFIDQLNANLYWQRYANGWGLTADHVNLQMNGRQWPEHTFGVRVTHSQSGMRLLLKSDYFNLSDMQTLTAEIGYQPKRIQTLFQQLKPSGILRHFTLLYSQRAQTPYYHIITDFEDLNFQPQEGWPGGAHLMGAIDATAQHPASGWRFQVSQSDIQNNNLHWHGEGFLSLPAKGSPFVNLQGKIGLKNINAIKNYLPSRGLSPHLRAWLNQAFSTGEITSGTVNFKGPLDRFPFLHQEGSFDAIANVDRVTLNYHSGWPALQNIKAKVMFHNNQLRIVASHANISGNPLDHLKAVIPDLKDPVLSVSGHSTSNLANGFKFLKAAPLSVAKRMQSTTAQGPMNLNLKLRIPLDHSNQEVRAEGQLAVKDGQFSLNNWGIMLDHINGNFHFINEDFSADPVFAKWLGLPIAFHIATLNPSSQSPVLQFEMSGELAMQALQKKFKWSILNYLNGATTYRALLNLHGKDSQQDSLSIATDLSGIQSTLPAPYNKLSKEVSLLTSHLSFYGNKLSKIKVHYQGSSSDAATSLLVSPVNEGWSVDIQNPLIAGNLLIPNRLDDYWRGYFSRLYLPEFKAEKKQWNSQALPPVDLAVDDFHYGKKILGKLALQTSRTMEGLRIDKLAITAPLFNVDATGMWRTEIGRSQTTLSGSFTSPNLGDLLKQWKITHALEGGKGRADFSVKWPGSPDQFKVAQLNGDIKLNFYSGRVTELTKTTESELGFGRLLNLFSLQSLPKLPLNLANFSKKGFVFNFFRGNFLLSKGVAKTQNASLVGDVAWVQIKGLIGFANKNYDLHLQVVPNITSTLPLIVGLAGGPLAGVIAWVADKILAPHVGKAAQVNYHIAGSWNKPDIILPAPAETDLSP
ncbi:YhdP family phospholipid transporter [Coxiella burnetii]|uniref:YhdP family phospholipid transporter n=1 Tax=Coxiella burnetii TaxID=777 RepID=UPI000BFB3E35|nr:DUF3971 domain-containing protein [Coxiella burnetii]PHH57181.1 DUF3971 domain-containing protein [Coxiella burnetii]